MNQNHIKNFLMFLGLAIGSTLQTSVHHVAFPALHAMSYEISNDTTHATPQHAPSILAPLYSFFNFLERTFFDKTLMLVTPSKKDAYAIVMDLGEVALTTNEKEFRSAIGILPFIKAGMFNKKKVRALVFDILREARSYTETLAHPLPTDEQGNQLPQLFMDWMKGDITGQELTHVVSAYLDKHPHRLSTAKRELVESLIRAMTDTQIFTKTRTLYQEALHFAQECKKCGYRLYVLSNWPPVQKELFAKFPEFFSLFDGVMLSGNVGLMKPDQNLYTLFLHTFELDPRCTIFVDDQQVNLDGAQAVGMHTILCTKAGDSPNFRKVRREINEMMRTSFSENNVPALSI